ncbi:hypothetical protein ACLB2K_001864 [Fragaria x ananassa]
MMSRSLRSKTLPLLFSRNPKVNPCELWALPSQALFSTHIVGEKPVLVRDFIHSALYDPRHGRKAYMKYLDKIYKGSEISWFTPVEIFKPWYAHGIAEAIMRTANLSVPLKELVQRESWITYC